MRSARRMVAGLVMLFATSVAAWGQETQTLQVGGGVSVAAASAVPAMQLVPAKSLIVFHVKNLQGLSDKIAAWGKQLNLTDHVPPMGDMLGFLTQQAKITQGLNKSGDMAVALVNNGHGFGGAQPPVLMLIPVSDYAAFLTNFTNATTEGPVTSVSLADGSPAFIAQWSGYAAMSPTRQVLDVPPGGLTVTPACEKELEAKDVCLLVNMPAVRAIAIPMMIVTRPQLTRQLDRGIRMGGGAKYSRVIDVAFNQLYDLAQKVVSDCDDLTVGMNLAPEGVSASYVADFKPDSHFGQLIAAKKNTDQSMLAGLPDGKYILLTGMVSDPKQAAQFMDEFLGPIISEIQNMGEDGKTLMTYVQSFKDMLSSLTGSATGMVAPEGDLGTSPLIQFVKVMNGDAKTMAAASAKLMAVQQSQFKNLGAGNMPMDMAYTPAAKTVDGVQFDQYHVGFNMGAMMQNPQMAQIGQYIAFIYGQDGLNIYSGVVNDNTYLQVGGLSDEKISAAVAAAKSGADVLGSQAGIQATAAELPKQRVAVFYLPVDVLVNTAFGYLAKFGLDMGVTVPASKPIGATVSTDGSAVRGDLFIPGELIAAGSNVGQKLVGLHRVAPPGGAPPAAAPGGGGL